jgi:hypothetical protein
MIKDQLKKSCIGLAIGTALVAGTTTPALAESISCSFAIPKLGSDSCTTGSVAANSSGHFVFVSVSPGIHWEVFDITNNVVVGSGQAGILGVRRTIFGLFSRYKLELHGLVGHGTINNT